MKRKVRVLFIGDNHIDDQKPVHRKDGYLEATIDELREALEIALVEKADAAVLLGDLFNRLQPGGDARNQVMEVLASAKDGGLRVIAVRGNHDMAHNPANYRRSALYSCEMGGLLEVPCQDEDAYGEVPELGLGLVHFTPHAHLDLERGRFANKAVTSLAAHTSIALGEVKFPHVLVENVKLSPETKLLVAGHIHTPCRSTREDGLEFVNPGSLCRKAYTPDNILRMPSVVLAEYEVGGALLSTEHITLKRPLPAEEVFEVAMAEGKKRKAALRNERVIELTQMAGWEDESESREESLESSGLLKNVSRAAIDLAISIYRDLRERGKAA
jgi:predicted phosphodiesterase